MRAASRELQAQRRAGDCPLYLASNFLVGRGTPCAPPRYTAAARAALTVSILRSSSLPLWGRRTCTLSFLGAQTSGFVGPKRRMQLAPAAAARCEIPLSCPMTFQFE